MRENRTYKKLGEVATFKRGLTYSGKDEVNFSENVVLRSNNIDLATNALNLDELKYISSDICIPEDKKLKADSIFMCMSNGSKQHLGKVAFIEHDLSYAFGGFMGLIIPEKEKIYPKYLYFYFCSPQFKDVLSSIGNGANINNIKFVDIAKYSIKTPPLSEQKSIVSELDRINELISLKKTQLSDLDALAQSIFYDMFGDPVVNEKGWPTKTLGELSEKIANGYNAKMEEGTYKSEGIMYFRCQNVWRNRFDYSDLVYIDEETNKKMKSSSLKHNDFLVTKIGRVNTENSSLGRISLYEGEDDKANLSGNLCFIRLKKDVLVHKYLLYIFVSDQFRDYIRRTTVGGIDKRALNTKQLSTFPVHFPPLSLQQSFADKVLAIEKAKEKLNVQIDELQTLLASRMQYWFD